LFSIKTLQISSAPLALASIRADSDFLVLISTGTGRFWVSIVLTSSAHSFSLQASSKSIGIVSSIKKEKINMNFKITLKLVYNYSLNIVIDILMLCINIGKISKIDFLMKIVFIWINNIF
jgi:hypothetical protein